MKSLIKISMQMAYVLRHDPASVGLELDSRGAVDLKAFSNAINSSEETIREIVSQDSKTRFIIRDEKIFAAQGHTIKVEPELKTFTPTGDVFHGTKRSFLDSIMESGLKPMSRNFVHLSTTVDTAEIVANRRKGESVILLIDAVRMVEEGYSLRISENGVVLTEFVPARFIRVSD